QCVGDIIARTQHVVVAPDGAVIGVAGLGIVDAELLGHALWTAVRAVDAKDAHVFVGPLGLAGANVDDAHGHGPDDFAADPARTHALAMWVGVLEFVFANGVGCIARVVQPSRSGFGHRVPPSRRVCYLGCRYRQLWYPPGGSCASEAGLYQVMRRRSNVVERM